MQNAAPRVFSPVMALCAGALVSAGIPPCGAAVLNNCIRNISVPNQAGNAKINLIFGGGLDAAEAVVHVQDGTDLNSVAPAFTLSPGAGISPTGPRNLTSPVRYTVSNGGSSRGWDVKVAVNPPAGATSGRYYDFGTLSNIQECWVDPAGGNDDNPGTQSSPVRTLGQAWSRIPANSGLTRPYRILIAPGILSADDAFLNSRYGTYRNPVIIQAAQGPNTVYVSYGMNFFSNHYLYLFGINWEPVDGGDGLHFEACDHVLIRSCIINAHAVGQEGLKCNQCQYLYVESCDVSNGWNTAMDFVSVQHGWVKDCRVHDAGDSCMYMKGGSAYLTVEGNEIYNGTAGGFLTGQGTSFEYFCAPWIHYQTNNIKFINNVVHDCRVFGIGTNGGYDSLFAYNTLFNVGSADHAIEVRHGLVGTYGGADTNICDTWMSWGGWGLSYAGYQEQAPARNTYFLNNLICNPGVSGSEASVFAVEGPITPRPDTTVPNPSVADAGLEIRGNFIWYGTPGTAPGWDGHDAYLAANNTINDAGTGAPQLIDPAGGNFRPAQGGNVYGVAAQSIPGFPGGDGPSSPAEEYGNLDNTVPVDRDNNVRTSLSPVGAYCSSVPGPGPTPVPPPIPVDGRFLDVTVSGTSPAEGEAFSVDVVVQPIGRTFDAWGVIFGPGGAVYSCVLGSPGALATGARPLATDVPGLAETYSGRLLDIPSLPSGIAGDYTIVVGLVPAGAIPTGPGSAIPGYVDQETVTVRQP